MAISHWEEVTIFESTEVGHCDPCILVGLIWIGWRLPCLRCEGKFGHTVCVHLARICRVEGILLLLLGLFRGWQLLWLSCITVLCLWCGLGLIHSSFIWIRLILLKLNHLACVHGLRVGGRLVLNMWLCTWLHAVILNCQGHLLARHRVRLLDDWCLVLSPLVVPVLHLYLRKFIWIYWNFGFQKTIQIWFRSFVIWRTACNSILIWMNLGILTL